MGGGWTTCGSPAAHCWIWHGGFGCIVAPLWQMHHGYCGRVNSILQGTLGVYEPRCCHNEQRAKGEYPVRIRLCRPNNVGGGDSGTDRDAAMGKDTSFYLRRLLREWTAHWAVLKVKTAISQLCSGSWRLGCWKQSLKSEQVPLSKIGLGVLLSVKMTRCLHIFSRSIYL